MSMFPKILSPYEQVSTKIIRKLSTAASQLSDLSLSYKSFHGLRHQFRLDQDSVNFNFTHNICLILDIWLTTTPVRTKK